MSNVLVTGGAGFIGSHLVDKLIELGHEVTVIDDLSNGKREYVHPRATFIKKPITSDLKQIFSKGKFRFVFHLASKIDLRASLKDPDKDAETNILGSLNVLSNCAKYRVSKVIFSSSAAVYSPSAPIPTRENDLKVPQSPYGISKATIESYLRVLSKANGFHYCVLRYSNVYGPRQGSVGEGGVVSIFIKQTMENKPLNIYGDGKQTRDFIYVKDVVEANILAMGLSGMYNVSTGLETSVNYLASQMRLMAKRPVHIIYRQGPAEIKRSALSYKTLGKFGWKPKVELKKGLALTYDWFSEFG